MNKPKNEQLRPLPTNELERLKALGEFDLDYLELKKSMNDLSRLAAKIAGTKISLINLIDHFTQWSISSFGIDMSQMPREESICQYTISEQNISEFEVPDLTLDDRFNSMDYVRDQPNLRYYFGIPLKINEEVSLGALCVMDSNLHQISPDKKEMLTIIADEIVNRLKAHKTMDELQSKVLAIDKIKNRLAHDVRGPISGFQGLAEIVRLQGDQNEMEELLEYFNLIEKGSRSVLDLANEILSQDLSHGENSDSLIQGEGLTLQTLSGKLEDLFIPQAKTKGVQLEVETNNRNSTVPFPKNKILQILGNLISNSIKFTNEGGIVSVKLEMEILGLQQILNFQISDTGSGMDQSKVDEILGGEGSSTSGTKGEKGYGFGLKLVLHLVDSLNGKIGIQSIKGEGTKINISIPILC